MRKSAVAVAAVIVVAGLGVAAVPVVERHAADNIKREIESDGITTVETVKVGLFDRSITLEGTRVKGPSPISFQLASISGLAWPLAELVKGHTPFDGWKPGDPVHARRFELRDVKYSEPTGRAWSLASIVASDVELGRYDVEIGPTPYRDLVLAARFMRAVAFQRVELKDFRFQENAVLGNGFTVGAMTMSDTQGGKFGALEIAGFEVPGGKAGEALFRVDQLKMANLDLVRVLTALSSARWSPGVPTGRLVLDHASATGFGGSLMTRYGIQLGSITTDVTREGADVAHMKSKIDGFVLAPPLTGIETLQLRLALAAMGLKEVRLGFDCTGTEDRGAGSLTVEHCILAGPGLAEIDFSMKFDHADELFWRAIDGEGSLVLLSSKAVLSGAKLVVADKSLLERAFKALATMQRQPEAAQRAAFAQQVRQYQPPGVLISEDMTKMLDTVARFVEKGGTLTIELKPDPPFGFDKLGYLSKPGPDLIGLLGATATLQ